MTRLGTGPPLHVPQGGRDSEGFGKVRTRVDDDDSTMLAGSYAVAERLR